MARLPTPDGDSGRWGTILNNFLLVEHNADGTLKSDGSLAGKVNQDAITDFETTTQLDARDTHNRDRANHTGTQAISTIDGLQGELNQKASSAHVLGVVVHDDDDSVERPTGYAQIQWVGGVEPVNMANGDIWLRTV